MINSRCPLPIGNIESMDRIPVSRGVVTCLRSIMLGAGSSIGRISAASIGPSPSIGFPSGSTTRPRKLELTGIPACFFVRETFVP